MILVPTLVTPATKVIVAAKLAIEHIGTPDKVTIGNKTLKINEV
jgi:hypothetical protein